jgi:hypothetical protein
MTSPYTYYLYHRPTGLKYYGVRYAKNCHPSDLWNKYFSSSKKVRKLIKEYGINSFDVEIRKVFTDPKLAILWEEKVLRRLNVLIKQDWMNDNVAGAIASDTISETLKEMYKVRGSKMLGRKLSEDTKQKLREARKLRPESPRKGIPCSEEDKRLKSIAQKGKPKSPEMKAKLAASVKGRKLIYLPNGKRTWSKSINS